VPLSPKEKDSDVRIVSSVGDAPRGHSPAAFNPEAPQDEGKSSSIPLAPLAPRLRAPSNPLPLRPRPPKKTILLPLRRKTKRRNPIAAAIG
jgi:hypothetical protein